MLPHAVAQSTMDEPKIDKLKTIYLFSGLGADYRIFQQLELPGYHLVHVRWERPDADETMAQYAARIKAQITTENPIFIGVSFGGMMAIEMSKLMPTEKIVLISSAKTKNELAANGNFFIKYGVYKFIPGSILQQSNFVVNNLFGADTKEDKDILAQILADTDVRFFRWAMNSMRHWDNETIPQNLIHIHGTDDKIIPIKNLKSDYEIQGGGHFMVLNKATEISTIILNYLR